MKRFILILILLSLTLAGCAPLPSADIAATTAPVYCFTSALCEGTGLTVTQLVTESVSCLHDYSLSVRQVKAVESTRLVVLSGGGLEDFLHDALDGSHAVIEAADTYFPVIDPSVWQVAERSELKTDPESGYTFEFVKYIR